IAAIGLSVAVSGKTDDAKVYTDSLVNFFGGWFQNIAHRKQKEIAFTVNQIRLTLSGFKQLFLPFTANIGNLLATLNRPNVDDLLLSLPGQDSVIISNRTMRFESALYFLIQFVGIGNLGNAADDH